MSNLSGQIGDVRITRILERELRMPIAGLIPAATPAALEPHRDWLVPHYLDDSALLHAVHSRSADRVAGLAHRGRTCIGEHGAEVAQILDVPVEPFLEQMPQLVIGTHYPAPCAGYLIRRGERVPLRNL